MKPIDRYTLDTKRIKFLANVQTSEEFFYNEEDRQVLKDNTFSFKNKRMEAPVYLHSKTIQVRYAQLTLIYPSALHLHNIP